MVKTILQGGPFQRGQDSYGRLVQAGRPQVAHGSGAAVAQSAVAASGAVAGGQCRWADTTVVKAVHAICMGRDGRSFPAARMIGDTWINSGYEGEILRCLPGSTLRVMVGSVMMGEQGMAVSMNDPQILNCAPGQAVRHYKDGMLKCAVAEKVPDCTERNNMRKWGTNDMFFTYVTRVCLDQKREMVGGQSRVSSSYSYSMTTQQREMAAAAAQSKARELRLSGMSLNGGVGQGAY